MTKYKVGDRVRFRNGEPYGEVVGTRDPYYLVVRNGSSQVHDYHTNFDILGKDYLWRIRATWGWVKSFIQRFNQ